MRELDDLNDSNLNHFNHMYLKFAIYCSTIYNKFVIPMMKSFKCLPNAVLSRLIQERELDDLRVVEVPPKEKGDILLEGFLPLQLRQTNFCYGGRFAEC